MSPKRFLVEHDESGRAVSAYGLLDGEVVEAYDWSPGGGWDWSTAAILDAGSGATRDFVRPAHALLTFLERDDG